MWVVRNMGVLYDHMCKFVIEELHKLNVYEIDGVSLDSFDYSRLKEELVLASFREIDVNVDASRWF